MSNVFLSALTFIVYSCGFWFFRRNYIRAITVLSCIYLVFLTIAQEMDVVFSIYFVFVFLSLIMHNRRLSKGLTLYLIYMFVYVVVGLFFQEKMTTVYVLVTRLGFFLLGWYLIDSSEPNRFKFCPNMLFVLRVGTITEMCIASYLIVKSDETNRLILNHQAIGGSISISMILVGIAVYYLDERFWLKHKIGIYMIVNLLIVLMSGTRGYYVIGALPLLPFLWGYMHDWEHRRQRLIGAVIIGWICCALILCRFDDVAYLLLDRMRLNESIGYRVYENRFVKSLFWDEPWKNKLFGFGLGGRANDLSETVSLAWEASQGKSWMVEKLLTEKACHNIWCTILFRQGLTGLAVYARVLIRFFLTIRDSRSCFGLYLALIFFGIGILVSMTYRISATCSVFETIILIYIAKSAVEG